jgi:hypothetical protein
MTHEEKQQIEHQIERARDGVGDRIDELDRHLRTTFDFKSMAREHAPQIVAGGAALGFLLGFGLPKMFRRVVQVGIPVALIAWKFKQSRDSQQQYAEI